MTPGAGVMIEFRDNATKALVWEAAGGIPGENDVLEWVDSEGVAKTFEVNGIKRTYYAPGSRSAPPPPGEEPGETSTTVCQHRPTVYVTEV